MTPLEKIDTVKSIVKIFESKKLTNSLEKFHILMALSVALYQEGDPYRIDIKQVE